MSDKAFCLVRVLTLNPGEIREIRSLPEALLFLIDEWPVDKTHSWTAAVKIGLTALKNTDSITDARSAFIKAAQAANIYVANANS